MSVFNCYLIAAIVLIAGESRASDIDQQQYRVILDSMNRNASPCEDFYEYACGNWSSLHKDAEYVENIGYVDHKVNKRLAGMLKEVHNDSSYHDHKFVRNLLHYYRSCRRVTSYDPRLFLQWMSDNQNIHWPPPFPKSRSGGSYDWLHLLAVLRVYGMNGVLIEESVQRQRNNTRLSIIDIDKPVLDGGFKPLSRERFELQSNYLRIDNEDTREEIWQQISVLEATLLSLADAEVYEEDVDMRVETLRQLEMPWLERYLTVVLQRRRIDRDMKITIQNLPYFRNLFHLLRKYEPEVLSRYLMFRFMDHLHMSGPRHFMRHYCVEHTRAMLPMAMHWLYEQNVPERNELLADSANIVRMFRRLRKYFKQQLLKNIYGLDDYILQTLLEKVDNMRIKIGNLPRPDTETKLDHFYHDLTVNDSNFYSNLLRLLAFRTRSEHRQLHRAQPASVSEFFYLEEGDSAATSSPFYMMRYNVVIVPLTLLRPPVYHPAMDDVFKYSLLGFLLAHEIMHGFDESGLEVDRHGFEHDIVPETIKENPRFNRTLNCLREKNPNVLDEKIADVSGLRWAYEAYFHDNEPTDSNKIFPPGKVNAGSRSDRPEFSNEQLFFLNFAQFFCGVASSEQFDFSEHGSDQDRVIDTLSNFHEFARVFQCPPGTPFNPKQKCQLFR